MSAMPGPRFSQWQPIELTISSLRAFDNPVQEGRLMGAFVSPSGRRLLRAGFWDGGDRWRVRFAADEAGEWRYALGLTDPQGVRIQSVPGFFICEPAAGDTPFLQHGPVRVSAAKTHLEHADGTPFFWLGDTAWNGPLRATDGEWQHYLAERVRQRFTAVQWVATQWRTAPDGDRDGQLAFTGHERIAVNPAFFQRLDRFVRATADAGLLNVPVLLWAITGGENAESNPGYSLPEDQAILLARYMVARWAAYPVAWILAGDGKYFDEYAARWRRLGRAVFEGTLHAPVAMHCGGQQWPAEEFRGEPWLDLLGYQSGHGDDEATWRWLVAGPPATEWAKEPRLFQINLEPPYENHLAYQSRQPHTPESVRRAVYWSLLNAPTAGVTYGGHGVWGWDDGSGPPVAHPNTGLPLPWRQALTMPGAEQMGHVAKLFTSVDWWRLQPDSSLLAEQPGKQDVLATVLASRSAEGDLVVAYAPAGGVLSLDLRGLRPNLSARWFDPRTGDWLQGPALADEPVHRLATPDEQDWVLVLST